METGFVYRLDWVDYKNNLRGSMVFATSQEASNFQSVFHEKVNATIVKMPLSICE